LPIPCMIQNLEAEKRENSGGKGGGGKGLRIGDKLIIGGGSEGKYAIGGERPGIRGTDPGKKEKRKNVNIT